MYKRYIGIKDNVSDQDILKITEFLRSNQIDYDITFSGLSLFETEEAEFRMKQIDQIVNKKGEPVSVTEELIYKVSEQLGEYADTYLDFDRIDEIITDCLDENDLMYKDTFELIS